MAIMARPRADDWLESEIAAWRDSGINVVVSLLVSEEASELGLQQEAELCRSNGIEFHSFPIEDRAVPPSRQAVTTLAGFLATGMAEGRSIAIHCRAGIGRSSLIAACVLIHSGIEAKAALALIREARGLDVPDTEEQRDWVIAFGEAR
jgi:protein-tyrosine phosphatase